MSKPEEIIELEKIYGIAIGNYRYELDSQEDIIELDLSGRNISEIKGLEQFKQLLRLDLSNNQIREIKGLGELKHLKQLDLSLNQIHEIKNLEQQKQLLRLDLSDNQIHEIKNLEQQKQLLRLDLSDNQIREIRGLKQLKQLRGLHLDNNQIKSITPLKNIIERLDELWMFENPISNPQLQEFEYVDDLYDIQKYFSDKKLKQKKFILPAKVMFFGNHAAGKSTFLYYLKNNKLPPEGKIESTDILKIEPFYLSVEHKQHEETVKLPDAMIYDFGGHDYYHGIYRAFFSRKSITLLVWCKDLDKNTVRPTENNIGARKDFTRDFTKNYWLHQLKFFNKQNKKLIGKKQEVVLMAQTYADKNSKENFEGKFSDFNINNEYYVSLKSKNESFENKRNNLRNDLITEIKAKRKPKEKPEYYESFLNFIIHYEKPECIEVEEIFNNHYNRPANKGETKEKLLSYLKIDLQELNDTGITIYYILDKDLSNIVWLNPQKTIEYIHNNILKLDIITKNGGIVKESEFDKIFDDTLNMKNIYLKKLLLKQKVVFHDKNFKQYIIPSYLPLVTDKNNDNDNDNLSRAWKRGFNEKKPNYTLRFMNFLPFGLINLLICLYGGQPDFKDFWRDQLIFTFDETYTVLIILDFSFLEIKVLIKKDSEKSLVLLHDLEKYIFLNIIDLYNNKEIAISTKADIIIEYNQRHIIDTPEDLYISVHGEELYAQHLNIKEQANKNDENITVYPINKETNEIDFDKKKHETRKISKYMQFTNNKNIETMKKKIFISYSKDDEAYAEKFIFHIDELKRKEMVKLFYDRWIGLGVNWDETIKKEIDDCDIMVCLISDSFLKTEYIRTEEVQRAIKHKKQVIPIIVRPVDWETCDFAVFNAALKGDCITYNNKEKRERTDIEKDAMWRDVIKEMRAKIFNNE